MVGTQCEGLGSTGLLDCRSGHTLWKTRVQAGEAPHSICNMKGRGSLVSWAWAKSQGGLSDTCIQKATQVSKVSNMPCSSHWKEQDVSIVRGHRDSVSTRRLQQCESVNETRVRRHRPPHTKGSSNKGPSEATVLQVDCLPQQRGLWSIAHLLAKAVLMKKGVTGVIDLN